MIQADNPYYSLFGHVQPQVADCLTTDNERRLQSAGTVEFLTSNLNQPSSVYSLYYHHPGTSYCSIALDHIRHLLGRGFAS